MSRSISIPSPWKELAEAMGSVQILAEATHSNPKAIRQWAHGLRVPSKPTMATLIKLFKFHQITPPW